MTDDYQAPSNGDAPAASQRSAPAGARQRLRDRVAELQAESLASDASWKALFTFHTASMIAEREGFRADLQQVLDREPDPVERVGLQLTTSDAAYKSDKMIATSVALLARLDAEHQQAGEERQPSAGRQKTDWRAGAGKRRSAK